MPVAGMWFSWPWLQRGFVVVFVFLFFAQEYQYSILSISKEENTCSSLKLLKAFFNILHFIWCDTHWYRQHSRCPVTVIRSQRSSWAPTDISSKMKKPLPPMVFVIDWENRQQDNAFRLAKTEQKVRLCSIFWWFVGLPGKLQELNAETILAGTPGIQKTLQIIRTHVGDA